MATVTYTVIMVDNNSLHVEQSVYGTVTWPSTSGDGEILFFGGEFYPLSSVSNTTFSFATSGVINLNNSRVTDVDYNERSMILLTWTADSDTVLFYVGLTWFYEDLAINTWPTPPFFLIQDSHTMVYWNTSYAPWGYVSPNFIDFYRTGAPIGLANTEWTSEFLATSYGIRTALKNVKNISVSGWWDPTQSGDIEINTWIDATTGILLKLTEEVETTELYGLFTLADHLNSTKTINIELFSCDFFGSSLHERWIWFIGRMVEIAVIILVIFFVALACYFLSRYKRGPHREK